jgi:hypothetical protein
MTTLTTTAPTTTEDRLRTTLRLDAVVTGAVGLLGLVGPTSWYGDVPGWLPRAVGILLLVVGLDLAIASRWSGRRLLLAGTVCAELALAWVAATVVVLLLVDLPAAGTAVLLLVGAATLAFGVIELRVVRIMRAAVGTR